MRVYLALPQFGPADEAGQALVGAIEDAGHAIVNDPADSRRLFPLAQSERGVFVAEMDKLNAADLLVADASRPDAAVGWCVAWFLAKGRLVVLCCSKDARASLPPLLAGNPSPWQKLVTYDDAAGLRRQAHEILDGA